MNRLSRCLAIFVLVILTACRSVQADSAPNLTQQIETNAEAQAATATLTPRATATATSLPAEDWMEWPLLPSVSATARAIYERGLALGTAPSHFSVFGDCQSMPEVFMGRYDTDLAALAALPAELQQTVAQFAGSFSRLSPTIKPGTTAGAILWAGWIDREQFRECLEGETPLDCELRVWNPSIVIINLGTHWEVRNWEYLTRMLDTLIAHGVLPILATKADNREGNEQNNLEIARAALQYGLPLWNFWRAVQGLPNGGLIPDITGWENVYLTEEGLELHRYTALQALDAVWRQMQEK
jgi:hypothetical protein